MTEQLNDIIQAVRNERAYQDGLWGGTANDDNHEKTDWIGYIVEYAKGKSNRTQKHNLGKRLIKCCALAVAAVESFDRGLGIAPRDPLADATTIKTLPDVDIRQDSTVVVQLIQLAGYGGQGFRDDMLNVIAFSIWVLSNIGQPPTKPT